MLAHAYARPDGPNESRDVIVSFTERGPSADAFTAVWTVWHGATQAAEFADQFDALRFARSLADEHQVPAWKLGREWEGLVRLGE
ncbi:MAG: hypothetical protein M3Q55_16400 [Acidobacteriota bacterium]|nr:hypothetical protein [Acidobacteriota bacterium]